VRTWISKGMEERISIENLATSKAMSSCVSAAWKYIFSGAFSDVCLFGSDTVTKGGSAN